MSLDFRRKRGRAAKRSRTQKRRSGYRDLKFEDKKGRLQFMQEKIYGSKAGAKSLALWAAAVLIVCMAAVFLVAAFGQRVSIVGDSMSPVLRNGDVALVNRLVYNFKEPARGDVAAFRQSGEKYYSVKRIVGLPGETVQIQDGKILIDGEEIAEDIHVSGIEYAGLAQTQVELGADEYFVIGDNHTASDDSRNPDVGNVSREDIYGQVWFIAGPAENMGFI